MRLTYTGRAGMQLLRLIYPPQCALCNEAVEEDGGLCGSCWRGVPFVLGLTCDHCGAPLPGEDPGTPVLCDACMTHDRPWVQGRAAILYKDKARQFVLKLKHGDRLDLVAPAARWLAQAATPVLRPGQVIVPVPAHWWRTFRRRYNQAGLLAQALGQRLDQPVAVEALVRTRATPVQDGKAVEARFANVADAVHPHPRHGAALAGQDVLIVDDVMTSGATLAAAAEAAHAAGAASVRVAVLARVVKDA